MKLTKLTSALLLALGLPAAQAGVYPQCPPADENAAAPANAKPYVVSVIRASDGAAASAAEILDANTLKFEAYTPVAAGASRKVCAHITGGDGWSIVGQKPDGSYRQVYGFGFAPAKGTGSEVMRNATGGAQFAAPTLTFKEGDEVYLALSNVGMIHRPDLFDQHSVHWHGFPQASAIFDGVPQASATVGMGSTFTYYYKVNDPGTYIYHCHVEATEHMAMGMMGILNVAPAQASAPNTARTRFAYNDGDGLTGHDRAYSLQITSLDSYFRDQHEAVQPLPFLELDDDYSMLNGRAYPMTEIANAADMPTVTTDMGTKHVSQPISAAMTANAGERVLLRLTNVSIDHYYTVTTLGLPMTVVGRGAQLAAGPNFAATSAPTAEAWKAQGARWSHKTSTVTLGGGEGVDVLIDIPAGAATGTQYYFYTTNLNYLSNGANEDRGGLMTTLTVTAP